MTYRDTWATCENCGKQFIFTVEEQRRLDKMGLEVEPTACQDCTENKEPETGEQQGVVKWYEPKKRYGFITMRSGGDIFFHRNAINEGAEEEFTEGAKVRFEVTESEKGPEAANVVLVEPV